MQPRDRRHFLKAGAGALAGVAAMPMLGSLAGCQTAPGRTSSAPVKLGTQSLGDRLSVITGAPGNVVVLDAGGEWLLVDSGSADAAVSLQKLLDGKPVRTLINTHYHADQTGGNALFGAAGAQIHAQTITKQWLAADYWSPSQDRWIKAPPRQAVPQVTFRDRHELTAGGERIQCGYLLEAHTRGDAYVYFRDADVLVAGDVLSPERDPVHDWFAGGWLGGRVDALEALIELANESTRIVPAYGPVMTHAQLVAECDLMRGIYDKTSSLMAKGQSGKDMLESGALDEFGRQFQDPARFLYDISKGYQAHYTNVGANVV